MKIFIKGILKNKIRFSIIFLVCFLWLFLVQYMLLDRGYIWRSIRMEISNPFLSQLIIFFVTFITLWALLYHLQIYKGLHTIFVKWGKSRDLYKFIKMWIWLWLSWVTSHYIIPWLNWLIYFFYNVGFTILYLLPIIWLSLLITFGVIYLHSKITKTLR